MISSGHNIPVIKICDHVPSCDAATEINYKGAGCLNTFEEGLELRVALAETCSLWVSFFWVIIVLSTPYVGITLCFFSWLIARVLFCFWVFFIQISKSWILIFSSKDSALLPTLGRERICQQSQLWLYKTWFRLHPVGDVCNISFVMNY